MFDDDTARQVLHTLADEPAPPVETTIDQVLRRGKRRVLAQRAASVVGVVAVVAAIGVGTVLLRSGDQGVEVGTTNSATPTSSAPSIPGWAPVDMPAKVYRSATTCSYSEVRLPKASEKPLPPPGVAEPALSLAVTKALGVVPKATVSSRSNGSSGFLAVEVAMDNGPGQLQLEAAWYGGTPEQAADADRGAYGNCQAPLRRVLADGTVLQLYPVNDRNSAAPTQPVRIYRPDGIRYVITSAGYSEADIVQGKDSTSKTIRGGRGKLPTSEKQLATLAERFTVLLR